MRVEIIAPMGAGKSSVIKHLSVQHDFFVVEEDLSTNPYIQLRKIDPATYALPCQQKFLDDKIDTLSAAIESSNKDIIADFSVWTERAYGRHSVADHPEELSRMSRQVDGFYEKYGLPDLLVCITISTREQMERIRMRGRDFEQALGYDFLDRLNKQIELEASLAVLTGVQTLVLDAAQMTSRQMADAVSMHLVDQMKPRLAA